MWSLLPQLLKAIVETFLCTGTQSLGMEEGITQLPSVFFYQAIVQIIPEITAQIPRQVGAGPETVGSSL